MWTAASSRTMLCLLGSLAVLCGVHLTTVAAYPTPDTVFWIQDREGRLNIGENATDFVSIGRTPGGSLQCHSKHLDIFSAAAVHGPAFVHTDSASQPAPPGFENVANGLQSLQTQQQATQALDQQQAATLSSQAALIASLQATLSAQQTQLQQFQTMLKIHGQPYTVVLALRSSAYVPPGFQVRSFTTAMGSDNYLKAVITERGLVLGGMHGNGGGQAFVYISIHKDSGIQYIAWRQYTSSNGLPHMSLIPLQPGQSCKAGYHLIPYSELRGNDNHVYFNAAPGGSFLGHVTGWSRDGAYYDPTGGYLYRYWSYPQQVDSFCFRVFGVDSDPSTAQGVFPVVMHTSSSSTCPSGWLNAQSTSQATGLTTTTNHIQVLSHASVLGGPLTGWTTSGESHMDVHTTSAMSGGFCWRYFVRSGPVHVKIETPTSGACPSGYRTMHAAQIKGSNGWAYVGITGAGAFFGGANECNLVDRSFGRIKQDYAGEMTNVFCFKVDNAPTYIY